MSKISNEILNPVGILWETIKLYALWHNATILLESDGSKYVYFTGFTFKQ